MGRIKYKNKKPTGERDLHLELWSKKKKHYCQNCDKDLGDNPNPAYFSHIIPKSKESSLRLDPKNFKIICLPCHQIWEFGTLDQIREFNLTDEQKKYLKQNNYLRYYKIYGDD